MQTSTLPRLQRAYLFSVVGSLDQSVLMLWCMLIDAFHTVRIPTAAFIMAPIEHHIRYSVKSFYSNLVYSSMCVKEKIANSQSSLRNFVLQLFW